MFKTVNYQFFRNDEHIQFNKDILYVCGQSNPETLNVKEQFNALKTVTEQLETAYLQTRGSELTKKITDEDDKRDRYITGIEKCTNGNTHHFNPEHAEAAEKLLSHIHKYGSTVAGMNYQAETTTLTDLIDFAKNDDKLQAAVTLLGLNEWFGKLEESNIEFNRLYMMRIDEEAGKPKLNLKELRTESVVHYRELIKHLSAHALLSPSELYETTTNKFNELIDKYNHLRRKS